MKIVGSYLVFCFSGYFYGFMLVFGGCIVWLGWGGISRNMVLLGRHSENIRTVRVVTTWLVNTCAGDYLPQIHGKILGTSGPHRLLSLG